MRRAVKKPGRKLRPILVVCLVVLTWSIGSGAVWFILPQVAENLTSNFLLVGALIALPSLIAMVVDIPLGDLTDKLGRKKIILVGVALMAALGLTLHLIWSLVVLIVFLVFLGLFYQLVYLPTAAYIIDVSPKKEVSEYLGVYMSFIHLGFTLGPLAAGVFLRYGMASGLKLTGLFYSLLCVVAFAITLFLRETVKPEPLLVGLKELIEKDKLFMREILEYEKLRSMGAVVLVLTFLLTFYDGMVWTLEPLYYHALKLDPLVGGLILAAFAFPYILFQVPGGWVADHFGRRRTLIFGLLVAGFFTVMFSYAETTFALIFCAFTATAGLAVAWPAMEGILAEATRKTTRGEVIGVWSTSRDLGYLMGPLLGGIIAYYSDISSVFKVTGLVFIASTLLVTRIRMKE